MNEPASYEPGQTVYLRLDQDGTARKIIAMRPFVGRSGHTYTECELDDGYQALDFELSPTPYRDTNAEYRAAGICPRCGGTDNGQCDCHTFSWEQEQPHA